MIKGIEEVRINSRKRNGKWVHWEREDECDGLR